MKGYISLFKTAAQDFLDDDCMSSGAAIAYYTIFSLPPLLAVVLMLAAQIGFSERQVTELVKRELGLSLSETSARPADGANAAGPQGGKPNNVLPFGLGNLGIISKVIGVCVLLFSAAGVFGQLQYSLNKAWEVKPDPRQGGIWNFILKRLLSMGMVVVIGFLLLVSLIVTTTADEVLAWSMGASFQGQALGIAANEIVSLLVATLLFAAMFKVLPDAQIAWRDVWEGAFYTAVLFVVGKFAIGWYLDRSQIGSDWGASAVSVISALVWVYYTSLIVLYGAEFTQAWSNRFAKGSRPKEGAIRVVKQEWPAATAYPAK